jgi:UDP-glucose 4-epimerase
MKSGHELSIFDRSIPESLTGRLEKINWIKGDFSSQTDISAAIEGMDILVHLISTTLPSTSLENPTYDVQTNLIPVLNLLPALPDSSVHKIIFASSGGTVYGNPLYTPIDESHPTNPIVPYGITKFAIERHLISLGVRQKIQPIILRISNPYGELQKINSGQGAIVTFLWKALKGEEIEIWGDGGNIRDYLYISDLTRSVEAAIQYAGNKSVFNIGSGVGSSINEILFSIEKVLNQKIKVKYSNPRSFDVRENVLDIRLANQEFNWRPEIMLDDGIKRLANHFTSEFK